MKTNECCQIMGELKLRKDLSDIKRMLKNETNEAKELREKESLLSEAPLMQY